MTVSIPGFFALGKYVETDLPQKMSQCPYSQLSFVYAKQIAAKCFKIEKFVL